MTALTLSRRHFLIGAGAAAVASAASPALARQQDVDYAIHQITGKAEVRQGKILLDLPRHSDAGTSVPLKVTVDCGMTPEDYPKAIHVFATENPRPKVMSVYFQPECGKAELDTRIRLDGAQYVVGVVEMADGTFWRSDTQVSVTFGACANAGPGINLPADFVPQTRISVPDKASPGELIDVRALISHPMETGLRLNANNQWVPIRIIERFTVKFNGKEILKIRPEPAIATNPYFAFHMLAQDFGKFEFEWLDTTQAIYTEEALLSVA